MYNEHNARPIGAREAIQRLTDPGLAGNERAVQSVLRELNGRQIDPGEAAGFAKGIEAWNIQQQQRHANELMKMAEAGELERYGFAKSGKYMPGLAKAGDEIGTQLQGQAFTGPSGAQGAFAPLVPQSISPKALDLTFPPDAAVLYNSLSRRRADGLVHETAVMTGVTNRPAQRRFLAESGTGSSNSMTNARKALTIRCEYSQTSVSLAGQFAGMITPAGYVSRAGMEVAQMSQMRNLMTGRVQNVWTSNSAADSLAYAGFVQTMAGYSYSAGRLSFANGDRYVSNLDGAALSFETLLSQVTAKNQAVQGQLGSIGSVLVAPPSIPYLQQQYNLLMRNVGNVDGVSMFNGKLSLAPGYGKTVDIVADPSMSLYQRNPNTTAQGTSPGSLSDMTPTPTAAPSAFSKFGPGDDGTYIYRLFGIGPLGETAQIVCDSVDVAAGDSVTIDLGDSGIQGGDTGVIYYWLERSDKNGDVTTSKLVAFWPTNSDGSVSSGTRIIDDNLIRTDCAPVALLASKELGVNEWVDFIDPMMFPLGPIGAASPFMVVSFGSPNWIVPEFNKILMNARYT